MPNLDTDIPFIPVTYSDGTHRDVTIREALTQAHTIIGVTSPNPRYAASLTRLLIAIMVRAHQPYTRDTQLALYHRGHLDLAAINTYLDHWHDRFDLDDPVRPFFQVSGVTDDQLKTISILDPNKSSGSNVLLWDHSRDTDTVTVTPAEAARLIIAQHAYGIGCATSPLLPGQKYSKDGPLARTVACLTETGNLHTTLIVNAPYTMTNENDLPAWERDADTHEITTRKSTGMADQLTMQSRRQRIGGIDSNGNYTRAIAAPGTRPSDDTDSWTTDPHLIPITEQTTNPDETSTPPVRIKTLMSYLSDRSWTLSSPHLFATERSKTVKGVTTTTRYALPEHLAVARDLGIIGDTTRIVLYRQCLDNAKILAIFQRTVIADLTGADDATANLIAFVDSVDNDVSPRYWATINGHAPQITTMQTAARIVASALSAEDPHRHRTTRSIIKELWPDEETTA
jgi:CRISPR-associated protein Cse1 (CRISPR_cse1)